MLLLSTMVLLAAAVAVAQAREPYQHRGSAWLNELTEEQRKDVERIVAEARPRLYELRRQMRDKMVELKSFAYDQNTDPDVFPRLGRELQTLRDALHKEIQALDQRIEDEVGVSVHGRRGRGCSGLAVRSIY